MADWFRIRPMRYSSLALVVAAGVAMLASALMYPRLVTVLAPIATGLYAAGIVMVQKQKKRGGVANPLDPITLVQGRFAWWQIRPKNFTRCESRCF
jgi:hypothetical protein